MIRSSIVLHILISFSVSSGVSAQAPSQQLTAGLPSEGDRVEVTTVDGRNLKGEIEAIDGTTVTVVNASHRGVFRFEEIEAVERPKDSLRNGTIYRVAVGGVAGALAVDTSRNENPFCGMAVLDDCGGDSRVGGMAIGAVVGALLGAGIDALLFKRDRTVFRRVQRVAFAQA